jgi:uncharacterized membrane protein
MLAERHPPLKVAPAPPARQHDSHDCASRRHPRTSLLRRRLARLLDCRRAHRAWPAQPQRADERVSRAALQNGTAFFASTSLIAVGGTLAMLRSSEQVLSVVGYLPFASPPTQGQWEFKLLGLTVIFVYAFFKFAWSYRLYNYVAIMIGAAPPREERDSRYAKMFAHRTAQICSDAGRHFNRGQRAFFFALGYLGWFLGPLPLAIATTAVVIVMWRRQFRSASRIAFEHEPT